MPIERRKLMMRRQGAETILNPPFFHPEFSHAAGKRQYLHYNDTGSLHGGIDKRTGKGKRSTDK